MYVQLGNYIILNLLLLYSITVTTTPIIRRNSKPKNLQLLDDFIINPWNDMTRLPQKVIDFDKDAEAVSISIPSGHMLNLANSIEGTTENSLNQIKMMLCTSDRDTNTIDFVMRDMYKKIHEIYDESNPRTKIYTYCDEKQKICRFLTCQNFKKECILCTVFMLDEGKDSTICEHVSTTFLTSQSKKLNKKNQISK